MFKKIKEFIKAFKDAYNTRNINKINAKKAIDVYSKEVDYIVYAADSLKIIFVRLEAIYRCFPIKERRDFIQQTLDLLRHGRKDVNGNWKDYNGLRTSYHLKANCAKNNLAHLKELYKKGRYDEVKVLAKEYSEQLEEFYVLYNVIDNPNESKSEEYKLMYDLLDELEKQEYLKYTDNSTLYISEDDTYDFFANEYDEYAKVIGKCFFNKELEVAVKILLVPDEDDYNLNTYELIYEKFENNAFGWEPEDYIWLQEQTDEMYNQYKITPYANLNNASENMFHVGKNGNLYTTVECGNEWYEFTEISNEEFEEIRKEAIRNN